jgi:hypothetical protein
MTPPSAPQLTAATPASACPACATKRLHTPEERAAHHPFAGHGFEQGREWSHEALAAEAAARLNCREVSL